MSLTSGYVSGLVKEKWTLPVSLCWRQFSGYVLSGNNGKPVAVIAVREARKDAAFGREHAEYCLLRQYGDATGRQLVKKRGVFRACPSRWLVIF